MKLLAGLIGAAALLGSGGYLMVYMIRWQWNRALFSGMAFIIVLVIMGFAVLISRVSSLREQIEQLKDPGPSRPDPILLQELRRTRPRRDHFGWLREQTQQTNVFITALLGGGALISGIAWLVGRIAEQTTTPRAEETLAGQLSAIRYPPRGIQPVDLPGEDPAGLLLRGRTTGGVT